MDIKKIRFKKYYIVAAVLTLVWIFIAVFFILNKDEPIMEVKWPLPVAWLPMQQSSSTGEIQYITETFETLGWENYHYDNKFQRLIFRLWNEANYEDLSKLFLYTPCFQINNIFYECKDNTVLEYLTSEETKQYYTVTKKQKYLEVLNQTNNKSVRITLGKDTWITIMILNP
jgi:hypothetical protein